ncbi:hypothetical protein MHU86_24863 [Fragilaria crotonensis]|nr:hypothetical protein MHU86_24863 [Fragilaria crotonensis]
MPSFINASAAEFCFIDLDFNDSRAKFARCAAFVAATDSRYGFSSNDLRLLGKPVPTGESGKPMTYRGSTVHRIQTDFVLQAGDFVKGNGSAGESIFGGKKFKDERPGLLLGHDRNGVLSMGNSGKNSNSSQFFITLAAAPQCNGKHVVFGEVVSGFAVLDYATTFATKDGTPTVPVTITDCGLYTPFKLRDPDTGSDQPDDEAYSGISPVLYSVLALQSWHLARRLWLDSSTQLGAFVTSWRLSVRTRKVSLVQIIDTIA